MQYNSAVFQRVSKMFIERHTHRCGQNCLLLFVSVGTLFSSSSVCEAYVIFCKSQQASIVTVEQQYLLI